jgi:hypothetical protein
LPPGPRLVHYVKIAECCYSHYFKVLNIVNFKKMSHRQCSEDNSVQMLDEWDLSDLEVVLSKSDDEFIPQGDLSESEC